MSKDNSKDKKSALSNTVGAVMGLAGGSAAAGQAAGSTVAHMEAGHKPPHADSGSWKPQTSGDEVEIRKKK